MDSLPEGMIMPSVEWSSSSTTRPRSKQDLLDLLPPKHIADRLVMRYFTSGSASLRRYTRNDESVFKSLLSSPSGCLTWMLIAVRACADIVHKPAFVRKVSTQHETCYHSTHFDEHPKGLTSAIVCAFLGQSHSARYGHRLACSALHPLRTRHLFLIRRSTTVSPGFLLHP